ncbi:hypothetical protein ACT4V6_11525 [Acinetobacter baumannii]
MEGNESYKQLAVCIALNFIDIVQAKQWEPYLKQVGFKGSLKGQHDRSLRCQCSALPW